MIKGLTNYAAVAAGGAIGTVCRYALGTLINTRVSVFPLATMVINVTGCFVIGFFFAFSRTRMISDSAKLAIVVGFVGGYTTFSTYIFESNDLLQHGAEIKGWLNIVCSIVLGLIAVKVGLVVGEKI